MRGHEHFLRVRLRGAKPILGVTLTQSDIDVLPLHTVQIEQQDRPEKADLRFVIGLNVVVHGSDRSSTQALCEACQQAGAEFAAGHVFDTKGRSLDAFVIFKNGNLVECPQ